MPRHASLAAAVLHTLLTLLAAPSNAAVVYHASTTANEDGRPGFDVSATSKCESNLCNGGIRIGESCSSNSDCVDAPDHVVTWSSGDVHVIANGYSVVGQFDFQANKSLPVTLNIPAGTVVKVAHSCSFAGGNISSCLPTMFGGGEFNVSSVGTLIAVGATITDIRDDTAGGDTNNDGAATTPVPSYGVVFSGSGRELLAGNTIRYAREIGRIGSMQILANTFVQLGGLSAGYGTGGGILPPIPASVPLITGNTFDIPAIAGLHNVVNLRGTCPVVAGNTFTGSGSALRIGPAWEDPYYYKGAIPASGTTIVSDNTIQTKNGILVDPESGGGGKILELVRFRAQITGNTLIGPGGNDSIGLRLAPMTDSLVERNTVTGYATPLLLNMGGVTIPPGAETAALMGLELHDNSFSLTGATTGVTQAFEAFWKTYGEYVDAEHNWWGDETGPKDTSSLDGLVNARGLGLTVGDGIDYRPFLAGDEIEPADTITIAATSSPAAPIPHDLDGPFEVTVTVDYELNSAASGSVRVFLRNGFHELLNAPYTSVPVTSAGSQVEVGPIIVAEVPDFTQAIQVEAILVPSATDADEVRSNAAAIAISARKSDFKLECVSDADKAGDCPPVALLPPRVPHESASLKLGFRYSQSSGNVDAVYKLSLRERNTGNLLSDEQELQFSAPPGFAQLHSETIKPVIGLSLVPIERDLVISYRARDSQGVEIGSGLHRIPILDDANQVRITSLSALDAERVPRGTPGFMTVGEKPEFSVDLTWRIGTKNVSDWQVVVEARAISDTGTMLEYWYFAPNVPEPAAATGSGDVEDWQSDHIEGAPMIPPGTHHILVSAKLRSIIPEAEVDVSSISIPVRTTINSAKEIPPGSSQKSFNPVPATVTVNSNDADGLLVIGWALTPIPTDEIPFEEMNLQQVPELGASSRAARGATESRTLIPFNSHFAIYDTLNDDALSATITFEYDPEEDFPDDPEFDPDSLVIAVQNPLSGRLEAMPSTHNKANHTVTADYDDFFTFWTIASDVTAPVASCGDPNADGKTTTVDALISLRASVGSTSCATCICDVNQNGSVSTTDALSILRVAVGQSVTLSCVACPD